MAYLLGAEVGSAMMRLSLYRAAEPAGPAVVTKVYREYNVGGTFLFSGFEMMLADFIERGKGSARGFGGVPAAACFCLVDEPSSLPWQVSAAAVESKFGVSAARVVRCAASGGGGMRVATVDGAAGAANLPPQPDGTPWTAATAAHHLAAELYHAAGLHDAPGASAARSRRELEARVAVDGDIPPVVTPGIGRFGLQEATPLTPAVANGGGSGGGGAAPPSPMEEELAAARRELAELLRMQSGTSGGAPAPAAVPPPDAMGFSDKLDAIRSMAPGGPAATLPLPSSAGYPSRRLELHEPEAELQAASTPLQSSTMHNGSGSTPATPDTQALQRAQQELARAEASLRQVSQAATQERSKRQQLEAEVFELRQTQRQQSQQQTPRGGYDDNETLRAAIEEGRRAQEELEAALHGRSEAEAKLTRTTSERDSEKRRAKAAMAAAQKAEASLHREKQRVTQLETQQQAQPPLSPGGSGSASPVQLSSALADVAMVRGEIAQHKREIAEHVIRTARHRLSFSRTGSDAAAATREIVPSKRPLQTFGGGSSGGYQLSAAPMVVLSVLTTAEAANERWHIVPRVLGAITSNVPAAAPAVDASLRLMSVQGTAVAIGVATGLGLTAALLGCWFPAEGLQRCESGDMFRLQKSDLPTDHPYVTASAERPGCVPSLLSWLSKPAAAMQQPPTVPRGDMFRTNSGLDPSHPYKCV